MRTFTIAMLASLASVTPLLAQTPQSYLPQSTPGPAARLGAPFVQGTPTASSPSNPSGTTTPEMPPYPIPSTGDLIGVGDPRSDCMQECCTPCGPPGRFWLGADYLFWSTSGSHVPALVTAAPPNTRNFGELGKPDTTVLYGNDVLNGLMRSGFQVRGGFWLDDCHTCGFDSSFFYLPTTNNNFQASSNGTNVSLFRPFFNTSTGAQGSQDVTYLPAGITGQVSVQNQSSFLGGDLNYRQQICCFDGCCQGGRIDFLAGYRILSLQESITIGENLAPTAPAGNILVQDRFTTNNVFQGAQIGLDGQWWRDKWFVGARGLVALGVTAQSVDISGSTVITPPGGPQTVLPGGLLALRTNIGHYTRDPFSVVPSVGVSLGRQITDHLRIYVGYDFIYWSNVLHAANQIDPVVNPYYVPTTGTPIGSPIPARPAFQFNSSALYVQGISFGLQLRF